MLVSGTVFIAILVMAVAAFATRIAGAALMSKVKPTPATDRFLEGLSVSVIAALVASLAVQASLTDVFSVAVAIVVMLAAKKRNLVDVGGNCVFRCLAQVAIALDLKNGFCVRPTIECRPHRRDLECHRCGRDGLLSDSGFVNDRFGPAHKADTQPPTFSFNGANSGFSREKT